MLVILSYSFKIKPNASKAQNKGGCIPSDISSDFKQELKYRVQFGQAEQILQENHVTLTMLTGTLKSMSLLMDLNEDMGSMQRNL